MEKGWIVSSYETHPWNKPVTTWFNRYGIYLEEDTSE